MNSFIFISVLCSCLLLYSAWTDGREGYIPDQVSILIFVLSLFSVLNGYGPGFLIRIAGALFCGGLLELIRLISKGGTFPYGIFSASPKGTSLSRCMEKPPVFVHVSTKAVPLTGYAFKRMRTVQGSPFSSV